MNIFYFFVRFLEEFSKNHNCELLRKIKSNQVEKNSIPYENFWKIESIFILKVEFEMLKCITAKPYILKKI